MALTYGCFNILKIIVIERIIVQHAIQVIHILLILVLLLGTSNQLTELDFKEDQEDTGTFLVLYDNKWHSVCYHGQPNTWGKREAIVTCRQLGYKGGWPVQIQQTDNSHPYLYNFDCDGIELNIKSCNFELATGCRDSKLAGIKCYGKFNIRIVDGPVESAGNVEVQYDNTWSAVCYVSKAGETRTWTFQNAQVVCRELGFPGTMITRRGGIAEGTRNSSVDGYKCREDLKNPSLSECVPDIPRTEENIPSCGLNNEAVVICAGPGYVGCYNTNGLEMLVTLPALQNVTTQFCRDHCRKHIFTHAYLSSGNTCSCGNGTGSASVSDIRCRRICTGDNNQVCGDVATTSVYDVQLGSCTHPLDPTRVYYYGDLIDLPCGPEMEPGGITQFQCLRNSSTSPNDLAWSNIHQNCIPKESLSTRTYPSLGASVSGVVVSRPNSDKGEILRGFLSGIAFVFAIIPACIYPFVVYLTGMHKNRKRRNVRNITISPTQDIEDVTEPLNCDTPTVDTEITIQKSEIDRAISKKPLVDSYIPKENLDMQDDKQKSPSIIKYDTNEHCHDDKSENNHDDTSKHEHDPGVTSQCSQDEEFYDVTNDIEKLDDDIFWESRTELPIQCSEPNDPLDYWAMSPLPEPTIEI